MELAIDELVQLNVTTRRFTEKRRRHDAGVVDPSLLVVESRKLDHRVGVVLLRTRVRSGVGAFRVDLFK